MSSEKALEAAAAAFSSEDTLVCIPLSDGGEGFSQVVSSILGAETVSAKVHDPLGNEISAEYGFDSKTGTAIIETAEASGLGLVDPSKRDPLISSSFGTGELIRDALSKGAKTIYLGLGGSATNDGGTGLLQALGFRFLDSENNEIKPYQTVLSNITSIDHEEADKLLNSCTIECFYDVSVPFHGEGSATTMFGPQKGLKKEDIERVNSWMENLCRLYSQTSCKDVQNAPGSGAAGGIGGAAFSLLKAFMHSGIDKLLDLSKFNDAIIDADLIITGEGKADIQTLTGKAPYGVLKRTLEVFESKKKLPEILLVAGKIRDAKMLRDAGFSSTIQITPEGMPIEWAIDEKVASYNLTSALSNHLENKRI